MYTHLEQQSRREKEICVITHHDKEVYEQPRIEIIEMEIEGILCGSGDIPLFPGEDW